jgi:3-oxoacyl-[acyl-carrier protein] reductase
MERVLREGAFRGETHLVTGAAQGIGRAVAEALAAHGAQVALVDLDPGRLAEARDEIARAGGPAPLVAPADVAKEEDVKRAVASVLEATGAIHGLVNVAGVTRDARIPKKSFDDFKLVLAVHLHGTFLFTREVAAQHWHVLFKEGGNQPLRDGANRFIVNFSSVSARNGNVGQIDYTAAKGAIEAATRTTAREFASYGARVNAIAPGPVETPMLAGVGADGIRLMAAATLVGRVAKPAEMAAVVCALADPRIFGYATGQVFPVNGGLYLA